MPRPHDKVPLRQREWRRVEPRLFAWSSKHVAEGYTAIGQHSASGGRYYQLWRMVGDEPHQRLGNFVKWRAAAMKAHRDHEMRHSHGKLGQRSVVAAAGVVSTFVAAVSAATIGGFGFGYGSSWGRDLAEDQIKRHRKPRGQGARRGRQAMRDPLWAPKGRR